MLPSSILVGASNKRDLHPITSVTDAEDCQFPQREKTNEAGAKTGKYLLLCLLGGLFKTVFSTSYRVVLDRISLLSKVNKMLPINDLPFVS